MKDRISPPEEITLLRRQSWMLFFIMIGICIFSCFVCAKVSTPFEYRLPIVTNVTRSLNTVYTPSATRFTVVSYSNSITSSLTITGGQSGTIEMQVSDNTGANFVAVSTTINNNTGTLVLGVATNAGQAGPLVGFVPPGCSYKFVSTGTSTFASIKGQELQL